MMKHLLCIPLAIFLLAGCAGAGKPAAGQPQAPAAVNNPAGLPTANTDNNTRQPAQATANSANLKNVIQTPQQILFLRIDPDHSSLNLYGKYDLAAVKRNIFIMDPDGKNMANLTRGAIDASSADWSPDKSKIVFDSVNSSLQGYPVCSVGIMDADGSNATTISPGSQSRHFPAWSPDGSRIANVKYYVQSCAQRLVPCKYFSLFTFNPDGSDDTRITFSSATAYQLLPRWFPDGKRLAFLDSESGSFEFWSGSAAGEGDLKKYSIEGNPTYMPWFSISPDGTKIAYSHDSAQNRFDSFHTGRELFIYDIASGQSTQLTRNDYADDNPCFSPDGRQIVFASFGDSEGTSGMFVMDLDGKNLRQVSAQFGDVPMKWK